jgi:hypothetical protein
MRRYIAGLVMSVPFVLSPMPNTRKWRRVVTGRLVLAAAALAATALVTQASSGENPGVPRAGAAPGSARPAGSECSPRCYLIYQLDRKEPGPALKSRERMPQGKSRQKTRSPNPEKRLHNFGR